MTSPPKKRGRPRKDPNEKPIDLPVEMLRGMDEPTSPPRRVGRPRKFSGDKDRAGFREILERELPAVVEFYALRRGGQSYEAALAAVAERHNVEPRTLERRARLLRFVAEPIAVELSNGTAVEVIVDDSPGGNP